ncbi:hypothetical protein [Verrucosispora sp. WMMD573]|uniref:hypothetical protein n=1 Tax=Verrucosispora sp. WMMD573 TaxID=3015149 RepID=UPI00248AFAD8|nr:hypothetical protein [Verrucosispora sp. WMMD573]WBB55895.1 hypothetical protein O7601_07410 [Verrucosispora sp. WMMD573]
MTATAEAPAAVPPPHPPRPGTVTVAFWLQLATVVILLGLVTLLVLAAIDWNHAVDQAVRQVPNADPHEVRAERFNSVMMAAVFGVPALLLALWLGLTAPRVRAGSNTARVMVFVAGGVQLLLCVAQGCAGALVIPFGLAVAMTEGPYVDESYPEDVPPPDDEFWQESDFFEALYDQPTSFDMFFPLVGLGVLLVFLFTAAVVLLLALPPAHRWFVPRAEPAAAWPPGRDIPNAYLVGHTVPMGYPAPPGVPVLPSYPPPPGYPPGYPTPPPGYPPGYPTQPGYPSSPWYPPPPGYGLPGAGYVVPGHPGYAVPGAEGGPAPAGYPAHHAASSTAPETPPAPAAPPASDGPTFAGDVTAAGGDGESGRSAAPGGTDPADR